MIIFEEVTYRNFLSTGKTGITIKLNGDKLSLIQGKNGSGKSSFMDAIHYALFGKPFRKIKLGQLPNALNKNKMLVTLKFTTNGHQYRVVRGMKAGIFEIYKNDEKIRVPARTGDYQVLLETSILGFSSKTFTQVVVLGSSSYTPFMKLSTADRRLVVEEVLDLRIFSAMNDNVKHRMADKKDEMNKLQNRYNILDSELEIHTANNLKVAEQSATSVAEKEAAILRNNEILTALVGRMDSIRDAMDEMTIRDEKLPTIKDHSARITKMRGYHQTYTSKIRVIKKEYIFYEDNDTCPSCKQGISDDTKSSSILDLNDSRHRLEKGVEKANDEIERLIAELEDLESNFQDLQLRERELSTARGEYKSAVSISDQLEIELNELSTAKNEVLKDLNDLKAELVEVGEEKGELFDSQLILNDINVLLKDDGIKSNIINKYIPLLNQLISKNLEILEFPCKFVFDKDFDEEIKSRGRDTFSYNSFSEGEKIRIDIALLFAFKELAQLKNSLNSNLLILDEADQGNLDTEGVSGFLKLLNAQEKSNIFIISHLPEVLASKVNAMLAFEKVGNFSKLNLHTG